MKLHYDFGNDLIACRQSQPVKTSWLRTKVKTHTTCENCKRVIGLSKVVAKGKFQSTMIIATFGRKAISFPVSDLTFEIANNLETPRPEISFIDKDPSPSISVRFQIDEAAREALLGLIFDIPLKTQYD